MPFSTKALTIGSEVGPIILDISEKNCLIDIYVFFSLSGVREERAAGENPHGPGHGGAGSEHPGQHRQPRGED